MRCGENKTNRQKSLRNFKNKNEQSERIRKNISENYFQFLAFVNFHSNFHLNCEEKTNRAKETISWPPGYLRGRAIAQISRKDSEIE